MLRNYFKTAFRNLSRHKGFTLINIASLTIGIFGCLVIGLFVWDEWQYDRHVPDGERIYRLYDERRDNNALTYAAVVAPAYASFMQQHYPEIDTTARMIMLGDKFLVETGEKQAYEEKGKFVDPSFFEIFPLRFLYGNAANALTAPMSVVLSEEMSSRFFGQSDPVGKVIYIDKDTFEVKGVLATLPRHFHLDFNYLMPVSALKLAPQRMQSWTWHQFYSYVKLKPGTDVQSVEQKLQAHVKKEVWPTLRAEGTSIVPFFQPLQDIHLHSADFIYDNAIRGNAAYVKGLTIIALFVLVIACFNFINLATARSFRRAREIGVRKVVGAGRNQLIFQFLSETVLLSLVAVILATIATMLLLPALNDFTGKSIRFNPLTQPLLGALLLIGGIVTGLLAGLYPALILSGFQPIMVLKNLKLPKGFSASWLRPALVVLQFALSVLLIICTIIVYRQTQYMNNKDLGFSQDQLLYFQIRGDLEPKLETFKSELRKSKDIISVTSGYGLPGEAFAGETINVATADGEKKFPTKLFIGDHDYIKTLGLTIIAGRDFDRAMATDEREAFIINETGVKEMGLGTPEQAIGRKMNWEEWSPVDTTDPVKRGRIIGVVKDFHYKSLHEKLTTSVIQIYPQVSFTVAVKFRPNHTSSVVAHVKNTWNQFATGYPIDYKFMDETYGKMYASEEKLSQLLWIFALMAIVVGCMGLFGLAAFAAEQRIKEIGIRKVLGASLFDIVRLLSRNFLLLVLIAALIAFPLAWWSMNNWLEDFPYRVSISWWIFLAAVAIALLIAFITVSFQSLRAATVNPVKSLRSE